MLLIRSGDWQLTLGMYDRRHVSRDSLQFNLWFCFPYFFGAVVFNLSDKLSPLSDTDQNTANSEIVLIAGLTHQLSHSSDHRHDNSWFYGLCRFLCQSDLSLCRILMSCSCIWSNLCCHVFCLITTTIHKLRETNPRADDAKRFYTSIFNDRLQSSVFLTACHGVIVTPSDDIVKLIQVETILIACDDYYSGSDWIWSSKTRKWHISGSTGSTRQLHGEITHREKGTETKSHPWLNLTTKPGGLQPREFYSMKLSLHTGEILNYGVFFSFHGKEQRWAWYTHDNIDKCR